MKGAKMGFAKEFKDFAIKGNVVDMAVGIIIGAGFGKIISSLVADVIMPPLGLVIGGVNFSGLKWVLPFQTVTEAHPAVTLNYGNFLQVVFDFAIVAFAMFTVIKAMNRMKQKEQAAPSAPPKPTSEELVLREIRDLLKEGAGGYKKAM